MAIQKHLLPCSVCSLHSEGEKMYVWEAVTYVHLTGTLLGK